MDIFLERTFCEKIIKDEEQYIISIFEIKN